MRRRLSLTAALVLLLSLLCACAAQHAQEMDENGYELYFLSDPNSAGGGDAIRAQEKRLVLDGAMETEDCVRALLEALLAGPDEPSLSSPIPEGTALKSLKVSGRRAQIDLSAQYARLTGIDLSLADYCITLTLTQLPNVNAVSITADGRAGRGGLHRASGLRAHKSCQHFLPRSAGPSGGVANQGDALLLPLRERVRERSFGSRYAVSHTRIELCTLGYRAGVIGAAMLARE